MEPVRELVIADATNLKEDPCGLCRRLHGSTLKRREGMDLIGVHALQIFDSFKSVLYPYPIPGPEHRSTTLGESMLEGYYFWDAQAMHVNRFDYSFYPSRSSLEITSGTTVQVRTVDE